MRATLLSSALVPDFYLQQLASGSALNCPGPHLGSVNSLSVRKAYGWKPLLNCISKTRVSSITYIQKVCQFYNNRKCWVFSLDTCWEHAYIWVISNLYFQWTLFYWTIHLCIKISVLIFHLSSMYCLLLSQRHILWFINHQYNFQTILSIRSYSLINISDNI